MFNWLVLSRSILTNDMKIVEENELGNRPSGINFPRMNSFSAQTMLRRENNLPRELQTARKITRCLVIAARREISSICKVRDSYSSAVRDTRCNGKRFSI